MGNARTSREHLRTIVRTAVSAATTAAELAHELAWTSERVQNLLDVQEQKPVLRLVQ